MVEVCLHRLTITSLQLRGGQLESTRKPAPPVVERKPPVADKFNDRLVRPIEFVKGEGLEPTEHPKFEKRERDENDSEVSFSTDEWWIPADESEVRDPSILKPIPVRTEEEVRAMRFEGSTQTYERQTIDSTFEELKRKYGKGFEILCAKGYSGTGIGKHEQGIANPIIPKHTKGRRGLSTQADTVKYPDFAKILGMFDKRAHVPAPNVKVYHNRLGLGAQEEEEPEYATSEVAKSDVSAESYVSEAGDHTAESVGADQEEIVEEIRQEMQDQEEYERDNMTVLPVSTLENPPNFAKNSPQHYEALLSLVKCLKAENTAQVMVALNANPDLAFVDSDAETVRMIFDYYQFSKLWIGFEDNMDIECFKALHETYFKLKEAGRYYDGYELKTFLTEWFCSEGIVVGDATPENAMVIKKVADLQDILKPFYQPVDIERFCSAITIQRAVKKADGVCEPIIAIMRIHGLLFPKDFDKEGMHDRYREFIEEDPRRLISIEDFTEHYHACVEEITYGRYISFEKFLLDRGVLQIAEHRC